MAILRCEQCAALNRVADDRTTAHPVCGRCKASLDVSGAPQSILGAALDQAIASSPVPVLVEFWAPWCGPCKTLGPIVDSVAQSRAGALLVLKLNIDADLAAAQRYGVQAVPSLVLFKEGKEVGRKTGLVSRTEVEGLIAGTGG